MLKNEENNKKEANKAHHAKKVPVDDMNKISESICKIEIPGITCATGFFIIVMDKNKNEHKFLITNYHVLPRDLIQKKKTIWVINNNGKKYSIILNKKERLIIALDKPIDITSVEILEEDEINEIKYLEYDSNCMGNESINKEIVILQHPEGEELHLSSGTIENIFSTKYEFEHTLDTSSGSSGSPVILIENLKVIGIHKKGMIDSENKKGTFIYIIIEKINKIINKKINKKINKNERDLTDLNINNENIEVNGNNQNNINIINNIEKNIIILKYIKDNQNPIILFDKYFFKNNKNKIKIYIDEKEYQLENNYIEKDIIKYSQEFEIKVKIIRPFDDLNGMSKMFLKCNSLKSVRFINFDTSKVFSMYGLFKGCNNLIEIFGISEFDTSNITNISELFSDCSSLKILPETLNWNTSKIKNMKYLFEGCKSLEVLPDISKWDTSNVLDMSGLFKNCISLIRIPDLQYWKTGNVKKMHHMFYKCEKIEELPDISFWNTKNVTSFSNMFAYCKSLKSFPPNISKWKLTNDKSLNNMFLHCESITYLPDISKWNTKNVENMNNMIAYCVNLKKIPDITRFNTKRVKTKRLMKFEINKYSYNKDDE